MAERATARLFRDPVAPVPLLTRELASERETGLLRGLGRAIEDPHPSRILREESEYGWRLGELYSRMLEADTDLAGFWAKRVRAVMQLPRRIVPADSSPLAAETADFCRQAASLIPALAINMAHQLGSRLEGVAFEELIWRRIERGPIAGAFVPVDCIDRPLSRFAFVGGVPHVRQMGAGLLPVPRGKFLIMRSGSKDSAWGRPGLDQVYWPWWFKKNCWKFYANFLDRWAQPFLQGTYKHKRSASKNEQDDLANREAVNALLEAIEKVQTEYGIVLPEDMKLELKEATRSGSANYDGFIATCTRAEALWVFGEVDTSGAAKGIGSFAKSKVSDGVRLEGVQEDAHDLDAQMREQYLRPLVEINYGLDAPVPRWVTDTLEAEDRADRRAGVEFVLASGLPVSERHIYQVGQCEKPEPGEDVVEGKSKAPTPSPLAPPAPTSAPPPTPDANPQELPHAA